MNTDQEKKLIIFLHGYGANGADLISLKEYFNKENLIFESPNAPQQCPFNYFGYQWFPLEERSISELKTGLSQSKDHLDKLFSDLASKHSIDFKNIFIVGFSQGSMVSCYYGMQSEINFGGIVGFSGSLPKEITDKISIKNKNQKYLLWHGKNDDVVSYEYSKNLSTYFSNNGISNIYELEEGLGHGISQKGINAMVQFILNKN